MIEDMSQHRKHSADGLEGKKGFQKHHAVMFQSNAIDMTQKSSRIVLSSKLVRANELMTLSFSAFSSYSLSRDWSFFFVWRRSSDSLLMFRVKMFWVHSPELLLESSSIWIKEGHHTVCEKIVKFEAGLSSRRKILGIFIRENISKILSFITREKYYALSLVGVRLDVDDDRVDAAAPQYVVCASGSTVHIYFINFGRTFAPQSMRRLHTLTRWSFSNNKKFILGLGS